MVPGAHTAYLRHALKLAREQAIYYRKIEEHAPSTPRRKGAGLRAYSWQQAANFLDYALQLETLPINQG